MAELQVITFEVKPGDDPKFIAMINQTAVENLIHLHFIACLEYTDGLTHEVHKEMFDGWHADHIKSQLINHERRYKFTDEQLQEQVDLIVCGPYEKGHLTELEYCAQQRIDKPSKIVSAELEPALKPKSVPDNAND